MGEDHEQRDESIARESLSLDGSCDVLRRLEFRGALDDVTLDWDKHSTQRSLGWPPHLVDSTLDWWAQRVHPDDRPRVLASFYRALEPESTSSYWSESYRFKVYDGSDSPLPPFPSRRPTSSASSVASLQGLDRPAGPSSSSSSSLTASQREQGSGISVEAAHSPRLAQSRSTSSSDIFQAQPPSPRSPSPSSSTPVAAHASASRPGSAHSASRDFPAHAYITVLDQLHITRGPPSHSSTSSSSLSASRPLRHAIGSLCALEQRIKTSEALDSNRARLMRHISTVSSTSAVTSASSSSNTSGGSGSNAGSFASAMTSPKSRMASSLASAATATMGAATSAIHSLALTTSPTTTRPPLSSSASSSHQATSSSNSNATVITPTGAKAFSFLDVEGVRTVLENTTSGLVMIDSKGFSTYINSAGIGITGYDSLEDLNASGLTFHYTVHGQHPDGTDYPMEDCPIIQAVAALKRTRNHSDTFWRKDGTAFPVVWSCSPISKLGKAIGAVLEFRDVTEEKALEKDKLKATLMTKHQEITIREANASKQRMTQFLDYIAHELRNPLHGIAANIEFLRDSLTALQATFEHPAQQRPGVSPLQQTDTPTASLSGLSTGSQSSFQSSSLRSGTSSSHSSFSHASSGLRARSPKLPSSMGSPAPSGVTAAALSSAILPSKPTYDLQRPSRPSLSGPADSFTSTASSDTTQGPPTSKSPQKQTSTRKFTSSPEGGQQSHRDKNGAFRSRPGATAIQQLEDSASQLSSLAAGSTLDISSISPPSSFAGHRGSPSLRPPFSDADADITPTPSHDRVHQTRPNPIATRGRNELPAWHTSAAQGGEAAAAMNISPLLADITKHTAHANFIAKQQAEGLEHAVEHNPAPSPFSNTQQPILGAGLALSPKKRKTFQPVLHSAPDSNASSEEATSAGSNEPSPPISAQASRLLDATSSPMSATSRLSQHTGTVVGSPDKESSGYSPLSGAEIQQVLSTSQSFITSIRECVFHATHITNNVLDLSRFEAGKVELLNDIVYPARVASLAVDMMMARAQEKEIELSLDIPEDQTLVRGDGTRLAQVFLNLLSNAIKFTPRGGTVTLRFRIEHIGEKILLNGAITDTGMGMSKEEMSNLFQRFGQSSRTIQAEFGGTGLGLTICQEIVTLQDGKMSVESEKGKGSTFSFTAYYQPASEDDVKEYMQKTPGASRRGSSSPAPSPSTETSEKTVHAAIDAFMPTLTTTLTGQASPTGLPEDQQKQLLSFKKQFEEEQAMRAPFKFKHILVAEDNLINQNIMKTYLKKLNYKFTIVANGQEVLDTFVNKAHDEPIDVVLMDCEMPVMDGRQATEHIRQHEHFRKNLITPLDSPFNLQLGAVEINSLQSSPNNSSGSPYSPPLTSPGLGLTTPSVGGRRLHRTPIIGLSGNARQELVDRAMASGMDDYVVKPFKLAELDKVLKKWESAIDDQIVHRNITLRAKEFLIANAATVSSPVKSKEGGIPFPSLWSAGSSTGGLGPGSPTKGSPSRPSRPPLKSALSASRLPREHMLSYGSPDRSARPKLPSRLSNEWVQQMHRNYEDSAPTEVPLQDPRLTPIMSEPNTPADGASSEVGYMHIKSDSAHRSEFGSRPGYTSTPTPPLNMDRPPLQSIDSASSTSSKLGRSL